MKIRLDHVTNSSSSGFIVSLKAEERKPFEEFMAELDNHQDAQNEGVRIYMIAETVDQLNEYTNGRPFDWASKPCGLNFDQLTQQQYKLCKEIIKDGGLAVECWVDYNVCENFEDAYSHIVVESFC